jgi:hypothetical protein
MPSTRHSERHAHAAAEFDRYTGSKRGKPIVESLSVGLNTIRDRFFQRIHEDVEQYFGTDSMSIPLGPDQSTFNAKAEIDVWQIVEAAIFASENDYVEDLDWMRRWLGELRLGESYGKRAVQRRVNDYIELDGDQRRLHFSSCLEKVYPEARKCPLVLYQLMPQAIHIVLSIAFSDAKESARQRDRQVFFLPGILYCSRCRGGVLDNGDTCAACGNPVWNYKWLRSAE